MSANFDLTFFYAVKNRFKPIPGVILFISAPSESLESLIVEEVPESASERLCKLIDYHYRTKTAYFGIVTYREHPDSFTYVCEAFSREEEYYSNKVTDFNLKPFRETRKVDIEMLRKEMAALKDTLSSTDDDDSKAS
jgi:hypothetical protein